MEHADLIAKLEAAEGPSRELDAEIAAGEGWTRFSEYWLSPSGRQRQYHPPAYTSSLDAALTLVPEGGDAIIYTSSPRNRERPQVELYRLVRKPQGIQIRVQAATLSLALCIAAIRARGEGG